MLHLKIIHWWFLLSLSQRLPYQSYFANNSSILLNKILDSKKNIKMFPKVIGKEDKNPLIYRNDLTRFHSSRVEKLWNDCLHKWRMIPLCLVKRKFSPIFKFHWNLPFSRSRLRILLSTDIRDIFLSHLISLFVVNQLY